MRYGRTRAAVVTTAAGLAAAGAWAQAPRAVVREGDVLSDSSRTVGEVVSAAVNQTGGWAFNADGVGGPIAVFAGSADGALPAGTLLVVEDDFDFLYDQVREEFGVSDAGAIAYTAEGMDLLFFGQDAEAMWLGSTRLDSSNEFLFDQGVYVAGVVNGGVTADGRATRVLAYTDMEFLSRPDILGRYYAIGEPPSVRLDTAAGVSGAPEPIEGDFDFQYPAEGRWSAMGSSFITSLTLDAAFGFDTAVIVDGAVLQIGGADVRAGTVIPASVGGTGGETWNLFTAFGVNESGGVFFTGDTDDGPTADDYVFANGSIVLRENETVESDKFEASFGGQVNAAGYNEQGDWAAAADLDWTDFFTIGGNPMPFRRADPALYLNGRAVFVRGDLIDWNADGVVDAADNNAKFYDFVGEQYVHIGPRKPDGTVDVVFTASVDFNGTGSTLDDLTAGLVLTLPAEGAAPCPCDRDGSMVQDLNDYFAYLGEFLNQLDVGNPQPGSADFDGSGFVDLNDYFAFLGCLPDLAAMTPCP